MKNNYIKKTIQLIFFAFVAKGLGFVREMVLANYYGANYVSDVFVVLCLEQLLLQGLFLYIVN